MTFIVISVFVFKVPAVPPDLAVRLLARPSCRRRDPTASLDHVPTSEGGRQERASWVRLRRSPRRLGVRQRNIVKTTAKLCAFADRLTPDAVRAAPDIIPAASL